jgi:protein-L-isoaspartate(D-aspartate) O-methyltransferase
MPGPLERAAAFLTMSAALLAAPLTAADGARGPADGREADRAEMLRVIRAHATTVGGIDETVIAAMARVPRHRFVPPAMADSAYADMPLPIGDGQTISQPFIVAYMTHLLQVKSGARVLEVGTGSGYQAAVLAELGCAVKSIEIVRALGERSAALLRTLGYGKVEVRVGDGYLGWPEAAPFDGIMVTAGAKEIPAPLIAQLKSGARLVMPLADAHGSEWLTVITKQADGGAVREHLIPVRFVPLTRGEAR